MIVAYRRYLSNLGRGQAVHRAVGVAMPQLRRLGHWGHLFGRFRMIDKYGGQRRERVAICIPLVSALITHGGRLAADSAAYHDENACRGWLSTPNRACLCATGDEPI